MRGMRSKCWFVLVPKDQLQKETQHLPDSSDTWERSHFEPLAEVNIGEEELFKDAAKVPCHFSFLASAMIPFLPLLRGACRAEHTTRSRPRHELLRSRRPVPRWMRSESDAPTQPHDTTPFMYTAISLSTVHLPMYPTPGRAVPGIRLATVLLIREPQMAA